MKKLCIKEIFNNLRSIKELYDFLNEIISNDSLSEADKRKYFLECLHLIVVKAKYEYFTFMRYYRPHYVSEFDFYSSIYYSLLKRPANLIVNGADFHEAEYYRNIAMRRA